jgi:hypothetical protein
VVVVVSGCRRRAVEEVEVEGGAGGSAVGLDGDRWGFVGGGREWDQGEGSVKKGDVAKVVGLAEVGC